jgi:hypothetical protein
LKQCLGDGENTLTLEHLTLSGAELFDLFRERALSHKKRL